MQLAGGNLQFQASSAKSLYMFRTKGRKSAPTEATEKPAPTQSAATQRSTLSPLVLQVGDSPAVSSAVSARAKCRTKAVASSTNATRVLHAAGEKVTPSRTTVTIQNATPAIVIPRVGESPATTSKAASTLVTPRARSSSANFMTSSIGDTTPDVACKVTCDGWRLGGGSQYWRAPTPSTRVPPQVNQSEVVNTTARQASPHGRPASANTKLETNRLSSAKAIAETLASAILTPARPATANASLHEQLPQVSAQLPGKGPAKPGRNTATANDAASGRASKRAIERERIRASVRASTCASQRALEPARPTSLPVRPSANPARPKSTHDRATPVPSPTLIRPSTRLRARMHVQARSQWSLPPFQPPNSSSRGDKFLIESGLYLMKDANLYLHTFPVPTWHNESARAESACTFSRLHGTNYETNVQ